MSGIIYSLYYLQGTGKVGHESQPAGWWRHKTPKHHAASAGVPHCAAAARLPFYHQLLQARSCFVEL